MTSHCLYIDGLVQDCNNSTADALELLESHINSINDLVPDFSFYIGDTEVLQKVIAVKCVCGSCKWLI